MKRDIELIRKMLFEIESHDNVFTPSDDPADYQLIGHHLLLLQEGGLITGIEPIERPGGELLVQVKPHPRLTWAGHEFLDAARDDAVWNKANQQVGDAVGTVSFGVLTQLLIQIAKQQLGMAP